MSGGEFSHSTAPSSGGNPPSTPSASVAAAEGFADIVMPGAPDIAPDIAIDPPGACAGLPNLSSRPCSRPVVLASEACVRAPVSRPRAMATTPTSTATPRPRRIHSLTPSERFIAAKTRPPISKATASEVAAPAA